MPQNAIDAFEKTALGAHNPAYELVARLDPDY